MPSKVSRVSLIATLAILVVTGSRLYGQAAKTAYSELAVDPKLKPIDPAIVESNEAAAAADAQRARDRAAAYNAARKVLGGQVPADDAGKKILDDWYKRYFLPSFTSPENRGELPELRNTLLNKDLRPARSAGAVAHVRAQVLTYMKAYAQSPRDYNFHPAVRYNAMLLIGSLNAVEYGARYANNLKAFVPDPLPEALDILISEFKSPTQIDAVRVAALVGIDRHVKLDLARPADRRIPGATKKIIVDEMIALLNGAPPAGRSSEGHVWMQRRAIDILAALGMVGAYPEANAVLERIVADSAAPMSLRCTASEALAQWAPNGQVKVDATSVSRNLGLIAVKSCKDELGRIAALLAEEKEMERLRQLIKKANPVASGQLGAISAGGGGLADMESMYDSSRPDMGDEGGMTDQMEEMYSMGRSGMGMGAAGSGVPTDPRVVWSRRRLKYQLTCVKRGLDGMAVAGKSSPHEKAVDQVAKAVEAALALTDPPKEKPDLEGLTESIEKGIRGLAFLAPEVAEIGLEPLEALPTGDAPPGTTAPPNATPPGAPVAPNAQGTPTEAPDPTAPADDDTVPPNLPPGV